MKWRKWNSPSKKPATAEFLGWLQVLRSLDLGEKEIKEGQVEAFAMSFSILAKTREDFERLRKKYLDQVKS
jgi:hypothetical protein